MLQTGSQLKIGCSPVLLSDPVSHIQREQFWVEEALRLCQRASKVISPFIIFAVFDVSFRRYKL